MMNWKDISRIFKGLFTTENVSDDEIRVGVSFLVILVLLFISLIFFI